MSARDRPFRTAIDALLNSGADEQANAEGETEVVRRNVLKLADLLDLPREDLEDVETAGELTGRLYRLAARGAENKDIEGGDASSVDGEPGVSGAVPRNRS
ncbi:hypothetical protein [Ruegeria sp. HKCCD8929]|uniref:hypothetical protein n=1 Tax=Ruegeria sp. HKCCD8929 TaxID=2683006 RepID=UPI00148934E2|nr:hypothetical protein [Ruegeria sp. HKCCD8929]